MNQYEFDASQHESVPTQVNTIHLAQEIIKVYRSLVW